MSALIEEMEEEFRQRVLHQIENRDVPVAVSTHLARAMDTDAHDVREALNQLVDRGDLHRMQAGPTKVYWIPEDNDEALEYIRGGSENASFAVNEENETAIGPCTECDQWILEGERTAVVLETVNHEGNLIVGEGPANEELYHTYCLKELLR